MKICTTGERLRQLLSERKLRQVDILEKARPYCEKYGVKLAKNDLSQYVNGKVEPGQEKLTILGLALNVSEAWLMGYDVSADRSVEYQKNTAPEELSLTGDEELLIRLFRQAPEERRQVVLAMIRAALEVTGL